MEVRSQDQKINQKASLDAWPVLVMKSNGSLVIHLELEGSNSSRKENGNFLGMYNIPSVS